MAAPKSTDATDLVIIRLNASLINSSFIDVNSSSLPFSVMIMLSATSHSPLTLTDHRLESPTPWKGQCTP
jgi:hypothetical protein